MPIWIIFLVLIVVGLILYLINRYIPWIDPKIKTIINVVAIIMVIVWLLEVLGVLSILKSVRI